MCGFAAAVGSGAYAWRVYGPYGERGGFDPRVQRVMNPSTGRPESVVFDSDGDLQFDTWSYLAPDGETLVRLDSDDDGDGHIDRRRYYAPGEQVIRTEYLDAAGRVVRTEPAPESAGSGS